MLKHPIILKRLRRFKEVRRAYFSWWILMVLYLVSLGSELICNNVPLLVRFNGDFYFPIIRYYPEDTFLHNGKQTRPDYGKLLTSPVFSSNPDNFMIHTPIPFGPYESIEPESLGVEDAVTVSFTPTVQIGTINIRPDYTIQQAVSFDEFMGSPDRRELPVSDYYQIPESLFAAIQSRFENRPSPPVSYLVKRTDGLEAIVSLSSFSPRNTSPSTVRLTFREPDIRHKQKPFKIIFSDPISPAITTGSEFWNKFSQSDQQRLRELVQQRFSGWVDNIQVHIDNRSFEASFMKNDVRFPYPPAKGHLMGIDSAGRDVFARILYGLRTSLTFGILLVSASMLLGVMAGAIQGYYGGIVDITAQRLIEIWSALPFLYVMILMGSVYGRSFSLLLFCYGLFNWIGLSYYIRAEFFRLRKQAFVEAARCMGLSSYQIIFKHILPNALVPVITFFPFSLVGAIGSLTMLDFLGFGLPSPTPSWGELMFQAQQYRWAWWLILYPSLALFIVMLCGVFIGEGIRNAYDPKRFSVSYE